MVVNTEDKNCMMGSNEAIETSKEFVGNLDKAIHSMGVIITS